MLRVPLVVVLSLIATVAPAFEHQESKPVLVQRINDEAEAVLTILDKQRSSVIITGAPGHQTGDQQLRLRSRR